MKTSCIIIRQHPLNCSSSGGGVCMCEDGVVSTNVM